MQLNLNEVIRIAQGETPTAVLAETRLTNNYWIYQSFLAEDKPNIALNATLPDLNRSIEAITLPDGSDIFQDRALMSNTIGVSISQNVPLTGGTVFASTGLQRIDIFATDANPKSKNYLTSPFVIGFNQPLFSFNPMRWQKEIAPLRYQYAEKAYVEDMEKIAFDATQLFFSVLNNQLNVAAAQIERSNADTLYKLAVNRFNVGRIAETEMLQIELSLRNAEAALEKHNLNLQFTTEQLRDFLNIQENVIFNLTAPETLLDMAIDEEEILNIAKETRSEYLDYRIRTLEAEQEVDREEKNAGLNMNLFGRFGLSQTAPTLSDAYKNLLDQEILTVGIDVPLADWGKARSRREIARSNLELTRLNVEQEQYSLERSIQLSLQQFALLKKQVELSQTAYAIAQKSNQITRERYLIGKIGITELNLAIRDEESARSSYINALRDYWVAYYDLRRITLYDFERGEVLTKEE